MLVTHGTKQSFETIQSSGGLKVFDYKIPHEGRPEGFVDNGLDAFGPGIYCFAGGDTGINEAIKAAASYAGSSCGRSGGVFVLQIDVEEDDLLDRRSPEEICIEDWARVVENIVERIHQSHGYSEQALEDLASPFMERMEEGGIVTRAEVESAMSKAGAAFSLEYADPAQFDEPQAWLDALMEQYTIECDPCSQISEAGGPEAIARYAIDTSENLWQVLCKVWEQTCVTNTGLYTQSLNDTFTQAVIEELSDDHVLPGALVDSDGIFVAFDSRHMNISKYIDLSAPQSQPELAS